MENCGKCAENNIRFVLNYPVKRVYNKYEERKRLCGCRVMLQFMFYHVNVAEVGKWGVGGWKATSPSTQISVDC